MNAYQTINLLRSRCGGAVTGERILPPEGLYDPISQRYDWGGLGPDIYAYSNTVCGSSSSDFAYGSCQDDNAADDAGGSD